MTMRCLSLLMCVVLVGCGDDEPAEDGDSGSSSTGADDDGSVTLTSTTVSTSATTTNGTTMTTDATTESSGTTDPGDSSSAGTETGADSSGTDTGGSDSSGTDTGGAVDAYGPCDLENEPQCPMDQECIDVAQAMINWCAAPCEMAEDCPTPTTGDAAVVCAGPNGNQCALDCSDAQTCPDGMECVVIFMGIERCVWMY